MQSHLSQTTQPHSDEEIKQAIALASEHLLTQLNPDYLALWAINHFSFWRSPSF